MIGVLSSVVGAYYYLRIVKIMFFDEPAPSFEKPFAELRVVLMLSGLFVLTMVIYIGPIRAVAASAAQSFF